MARGQRKRCNRSSNGSSSTFNKSHAETLQPRTCLNSYHVATKTPSHEDTKTRRIGALLRVFEFSWFLRRIRYHNLFQEAGRCERRSSRPVPSSSCSCPYQRRRVARRRTAS